MFFPLGSAISISVRPMYVKGITVALSDTTLECPVPAKLGHSAAIIYCPLLRLCCCKTMTTPMVAQLMNRDRYTGKLFLLGMASGRIIVAENWSEISFTTVSGVKQTSNSQAGRSAYSQEQALDPVVRDQLRSINVENIWSEN